MNRHFPKNRQMGNKQIRVCSSLPSREMPIKSDDTVSPHTYHNDYNKNSDNTTCWGGCGEV